MTKADKEGQRKAPILRFKGFTDAWEQRKLSDFAHIIVGGTPSTKKNEYWNGNIPWMSSGEINKKRIYKTDKSITKLGLENSSAKFVPENSVLIALAGQGKTRGKVAINNIELTINQSLAGLIPTRESYYEFIFYNLEKRYFELRRLSSGAGSRGGLNKKLIQNIKIQIPDLKEQTLISKLSETLDKVLTLYERKLKLLSQVKKYFLDNLFTEKEYPNLRFKGFTDAWEQRKLEDIVEKIGTGKSNFKKSKKDIKNIFPILGSTSIIGYDSSYDYDGNFILTARVGNAGNLYKYCGKAKISDNTIYIQSNEIEFSFPLLMHNNLKKLSFGSGRSLIKSSELKKYKVTIPNKNEKECIGNIFYLLDNLITLYENKKQNIIKIKKELLNTMFI